MSLAIVKLVKVRKGHKHHFIDYISANVAYINGIEIQGDKHREGEWSPVEIVKIYDNDR